MLYLCSHGLLTARLSSRVLRSPRTRRRMLCSCSTRYQPAAHYWSVNHRGSPLALSQSAGLLFIDLKNATSNNSPPTLQQTASTFNGTIITIQ